MSRTPNVPRPLAGDASPDQVDPSSADAGRGGRHRARRPRAGRNLPAAFAVGGTLGGLVLASLLWWRPLFLIVVVAAVGVATWELVRAVRATGANPPLPPLLVGGLVMTGVAWFFGPEALALGLFGTVLATWVWRLAGGPAGYHRDVAASTLVSLYVPFLAGFAVLLLTPADGVWRVILMLVLVVLSDTGGYVAGIFFGRHRMAPSVSPNKSWEGFAGSLSAAAVGGAVGLPLLFDAPWWAGALLGGVVAGAAVLGDLAESMLKRDLGIKDMSGLLPGHGGVLDRVDSILFAAPTAYLMLAVVAPPA